MRKLHAPSRCMIMILSETN